MTVMRPTIAPNSTLAIAVMKSMRFGATLGVLVAALTSVAMSAWDWLENPGGIFRGADGTHWAFVFETLASWFLPTLIYVAVIASLCHLVVFWFRRTALGRRRR
jgi:hypothetical protein